MVNIFRSKASLAGSALLLFFPAAFDQASAAGSSAIAKVMKSLRVREDGSRTASSSSGPDLSVRSMLTESGHLRSLGAPIGGEFVAPVRQVGPEASARSFLDEHRDAFGIDDPRLGFELARVTSARSRNYVRLQQTCDGVPVFGAEALVQLNDRGGIESVLSDVMREFEGIRPEGFSVNPSLGARVAARIAEEEARRRWSSEYGVEWVEHAGVSSTIPRLFVYEPAVVGESGPTRLVWLVDVGSRETQAVQDRFLVDASTAEIALRYSLVMAAKNRQIYNSTNTSADPGLLARSEGDGPSGIADVDEIYDFLGDTYDFYWNTHARDGTDGFGLRLAANALYCNPGDPCPWPNAAWSPSTQFMYYGLGMGVDDVVGHELTHGVTCFESGLIYLNQSGAINESFSDIWGEFIDQTNGVGSDGVGFDWLIGEDLPFGAIRSMLNPPAFSDPDRMKSPLWFSGTADNGGVHSNSGVGNKLAYLLTEGGPFNGHTITAMGMTKVAELFYEAQVNLLTQSSDYADLYVQLKQSAINLGWTVSERQNLEDASRAVEINAIFFVATTASLDSVISGSGASWGDYDGDGDDDLYVVLPGQANLLYRNQGGGAFLEVTPVVLANPANGVGATWVDFDGDYDLDLYLVNDGAANKLYRNDGAAGFVDATSTPIDDAGPNRGAAWADYDLDGDLDLFLVSQFVSNRLFRNDGGGAFTDVTAGPLADFSAGVGAAWADYDGDNDPDLLVTNEFFALNLLLRNDAGVFTNVAAGPVLGSGQSSAADWGDYDNDGDLDLYLIGNGKSNALLRNDGAGVFTDVASGPVANSGACLAGKFIDYDNDGNLDIHFANDGGGGFLLRGDGAGGFTNETDYNLRGPRQARGTAWSDYNDDGASDLYVAVASDPNLLFRNGSETGNHWLKVDLRGTTSNSFGVGANIRVVAGGVSRDHEISLGTHVTSQSSLTALFGLGTATVVDSLVISWPSGIVQTNLDLAADRRVVVTESAASTGLDAEDEMPTVFDLHPNTPNPFNPSTSIRYDVPGGGGAVTLVVYDARGRRIRTLVDGFETAGRKRAVWNGTDESGRRVASGVYFYRLAGDGFSETRKMLLLK